MVTVEGVAAAAAVGGIGAAAAVGGVGAAAAAVAGEVSTTSGIDHRRTKAGGREV